MRKKLKLIAYIISLVTTVIIGIFSIPTLCFPLIWMVPMTIAIKVAYDNDKRLTPGFIVWASLLLSNPAIAILLLYSENKWTRRRWCYLIALISTIIFGIFLLPLAWMIPFTTKLNKMSSAELEPTLPFKICLLIFFGPIPLTIGVLMGILYLTETKAEDF